MSDRAAPDLVFLVHLLSPPNHAYVRSHLLCFQGGQRTGRPFITKHKEEKVDHENKNKKKNRREFGLRIVNGTSLPPIGFALFFFCISFLFLEPFC